MTATDWGILIPAVVGCLTAVTALVRAELANKKVTGVANSISDAIDIIKKRNTPPPAAPPTVPPISG
jgi:hypothetical protein